MSDEIEIDLSKFIKNDREDEEKDVEPVSHSDQAIEETAEFDWEGRTNRSCEYERDVPVQNMIGAWEEQPVICTFSGLVDASAIGRMIYWECPECGHEHEDDMTYEDYEPDPDEAHDDGGQR